MSGHINLQTSWFLALLESAIMGSGVGKEMCVWGGGYWGGSNRILSGFIFVKEEDFFL